MDIISFSREEILDHFRHGITYQYPAILHNLEYDKYYRYGNITRLKNDFSWHKLFDDWEFVNKPVIDEQYNQGWCLAAYREPLIPGKYKIVMEVLVTGEPGVPRSA